MTIMKYKETKTMHYYMCWDGPLKGQHVMIDDAMFQNGDVSIPVPVSVAQGKLPLGAQVQRDPQNPSYVDVVYRLIIVSEELCGVMIRTTYLSCG